MKIFFVRFFCVFLPPLFIYLFIYFFIVVDFVIHWNESAMGLHQEYFLKHNHFIFLRKLYLDLILNPNSRCCLLLIWCTKQAGKSCTGKKVSFWSVKSSEWSKAEVILSATKNKNSIPLNSTQMAACPKLTDNLQTVGDVL